MNYQCKHLAWITFQECCVPSCYLCTSTGERTSPFIPRGKKKAASSNARANIQLTLNLPSKPAPTGTRIQIQTPLCLFALGWGFKTWLVAKRASVRVLPEAEVLEIILLYSHHCRLITNKMLCQLERKKPPQFLVLTCCFLLFSTELTFRAVCGCLLCIACECSHPGSSRGAVWWLSIISVPSQSQTQSMTSYPSGRHRLGSLHSPTAFHH